MSMLRHRFSNERWGGGGGGVLNHFPLLFCKSVCTYKEKSENGEKMEQQRPILMKNFSLSFLIIFREFLMHLNFKAFSAD